MSLVSSDAAIALVAVALVVAAAVVIVMLFLLFLLLLVLLLSWSLLLLLLLCCDPFFNDCFRSETGIQVTLSLCVEMLEEEDANLRDGGFQLVMVGGRRRRRIVGRQTSLLSTGMAVSLFLGAIWRRKVEAKRIERTSTKRTCPCSAQLV